MAREKNLDELDANEGATSRSIAKLHSQGLDAEGSKLLKSSEELMTPKGRAELIVAEQLPLAGEALRRLLSVDPTEFTNPAQSSGLRVQLEAVLAMFEIARNLSPSSKSKHSVQQLTQQLAGHAMTQALAQRMARKHARPRIVDAAIPAQADVSPHTSHVNDSRARVTEHDDTVNNKVNDSVSSHEATATKDQGGLGG